MARIKLGEVEYNLTFNMGFLEKVYEEFGLNLLNGIEPGQNFVFCRAIIYCGIACNFEEAKKPMPFTKEECFDLIKKLHPVSVTKVLTEYTDWMTTPAEIPTGKKESGRQPAKFRVAKA